MCATARSHAVDARIRLGCRSVRSIRARTFRAAALDGATCFQRLRLMELDHAVLERVNCAQRNTRLPHPARGAAFGLRYARTTTRVHETGLLRVIAQCLQQPRAPAGKAWSAHPPRTAFHQPRSCLLTIGSGSIRVSW